MTIGVAPSASFTRARRLLTAADFQAVFSGTEKRISRRYYLVLFRHNQGVGPRLGMVVARKNIRLATRRNRIKRVARETFRQHQHLLGAVDILFLPRRGIDDLAPGRQTRLLCEAWRDLAAALKGEAPPCPPEP
ncbi:MAG: ribonuclease P protein component [Gammaproteobacteria bacterium]|nr:ribonuclease P protein component [Gammaproteobacteria bacterium]